MSAQHALAHCCRAGVFDIAPLLMLRRVSRGVKCPADDALGAALGRRGWAFRLGADAGVDAEGCARLRRLCAALGRPPAFFTMEYAMAVDCSARTGAMVVSPPLSTAVQLCGVGCRFVLTLFIFSARSARGAAPRGPAEAVPRGSAVALPGLAELHIAGEDAAARLVLEWMLHCGTPQLASLSSVSLAGHLLTARATAELMTTLAGLPGLASLGLIRNSLIKVDGLEALKGLTELDLSSNHLGEREQSRLAAVISGAPALNKLNLSANCLADRLLDLAAPLARSTSLTWLNLSKNSLISGGRNVLLDLLPCLTGLAHLNLASNYLRIVPGELYLTALTALTYLDVSGNGNVRWVTAGAPQLTMPRCRADGVYYRGDL